MVQEFHVLRCFSCESFQVQQVKKVNRWTCKVCGEKQSLLKEFGRGSGADCRRHVQKLNAMRGAVIEKQEHNMRSPWEEEEADAEEEPEQERDDQVGQTQVSRWNKYLGASEEAEPEEDGALTDRKKTRSEQTAPAQSRLRGKLVGPSATTTGRTRSSPTRSSPTRSSPTRSCPTRSSPTRSSPTRSSPPSRKRAKPCSPRTVPVSRWTGGLLSSHCQVRGGGGLPVTPRSQPMNGASSLSNDVTRPRPPLPGSSLFETGEEFSFEDEDFLTGPRP